ncbi:oligo-1,6-glucosidase [Ligilactobacillus acidipiscis]|nr:oligo-1,6-glucosidase [Ligilactobacillus acidipiscis]GEN21448.1 glucohydrolase [Ligilactobacillus acidipiscis]
MKERSFKNSVVYQIYPRSFQDSNSDGIGDLAGIKQRIPYLKKLGIDVVWLNPIYRSPDVDNGYDISDYRDIQPVFGSMKDFDSLLSELHEAGIKLMMDLVVNHTSNQHKWFQESKKSKEGPYSNFYIWRDPVNGHEPNNWGSIFSRSAWTYVPERKQYYLHLFASEQPDLNWDNPQVRQEVYDIMKSWLNKGVDGYRLDAINLISKPDGLPDAPQAEGANYGNVQSIVSCGPHFEEYIREMNENVLSHYDVMTVGEMDNTSPEQARNYANLDGKELNMIFQFEHVNLSPNPNPALGKWNDEPVKLVELKQVLSHWEEALDGQAWNSLYWNNHDQPRAVSRFATDEPKYRKRAAKMLGTTLHMMQGTPYIYEGEEIGMTNAHFTSLKQYEDLDSINAYHECVEEQNLVSSQKMLSYLADRSRDNSRTPMQWNNKRNAGFSNGEPWFDLNANYKEINVEESLADPDSVLYYYKKLIELRHKYDIIQKGDYVLLDPEDQKAFAYKRHYQGEELLVISNFTSEAISRNYGQENARKLLVSNYSDDKQNELRPFESKAYLI